MPRPATPASPTPSPASTPGELGLLRIQEVASELGLTTRSIRYYEELGLLSPAARSEGAYRLYDASDVERLRFIKELRDDAGFSLAEIGQLLEDEAARVRSREAFAHTVDLDERRALVADSLERADRQVGILQAKIDRLAGDGRGRRGAPDAPAGPPRRPRRRRHRRASDELPRHRRRVPGLARVPPSQLPAVLRRPAHLAHRDVDDGGRPELAHPPADRQPVRPGPRHRVPVRPGPRPRPVRRAHRRRPAEAADAVRHPDRRDGRELPALRPGGDPRRPGLARLPARRR